jgi:hypothetical protein
VALLRVGIAADRDSLIGQVDDQDEEPDARRASMAGRILTGRSEDLSMTYPGWSDKPSG